MTSLRGIYCFLVVWWVNRLRTCSSLASFTTSPMKVYIEDTDAYGILYNANYLRAYDRAMHLTTTTTTTTTTPSSSSSSKTALLGGGGGLVGQHEGWSIVSLEKQRFAASPALGGEFVVHADLLDSSQHWERWDLQMTSPDGATVYNTVKNLQIAKPSDENEKGNLFSLQEQGMIQPFIQPTESTIPMCTDRHTIYRDEIDAHWTGHMPLRNVLNLFERSRTNWFGGPDTLRRLQQEDNIIVVVTAIKSCTLVDEDVVCAPGQEVEVDTFFKFKRKGMVVECYQTLKVGDKRLAQGQVNLLMVDNAKRRPTSKLPTWLLERFGLVPVALE